MSSHKSQQHLPNISSNFEFMSGLYLLNLAIPTVLELHLRLVLLI